MAQVELAEQGMRRLPVNANLPVLKVPSGSEPDKAVGIDARMIGSDIRKDLKVGPARCGARVGRQYLRRREMVPDKGERRISRTRIQCAQYGSGPDRARARKLENTVRCKAGRELFRLAPVAAGGVARQEVRNRFKIIRREITHSKDSVRSETDTQLYPLASNRLVSG